MADSLTEFDVVVVGGACIDHLLLGPELPKPGDSFSGHQLVISPGGKGLNQAIAATRLGARTAFYGRVGMDAAGDDVIRALESDGVDYTLVRRDSHAQTSATLIMADQQGHKQTMNVPGANRSMSPDDVLAASAVIRSAKAVIVQLEIPMQTVAAAVSLAREAGVLVIFDPAPPSQVTDELLMGVVVKPNAREAETLTGIRVQDADSGRRAAKRLLDRGAHAVAMEVGKEGNLVASREEDALLPRISVPAIEPTGAGDAFAAALAVELGRGRPLVEAAKFASAAAALTTTIPGANAALPRREAVEALLASQTRATLKS